MYLNKGTDKEGYIINQIHKNNIYEPWLSLVNETIYEIKDKFKSDIHSIYIYGSVGRGNPRLNFSDLDLTVVLNIEITDAVTKEFQSINQRLTAKYNFVREIGFDLGFIEDVLNKKNLYSWGFWIKSCNYCLDGHDLSNIFPRFRPSYEISRAINGDIKESIDTYITKINSSSNEKVTKLYCQQVMKKIIRTGFTSTLKERNFWTEDLEIAYKIFSMYYPHKKTLIEEVFNLINNPISDKEKLTNLLNKFNWLTF